MDPLTLIVRTVCREAGIACPSEVDRIKGRVQSQLAAQLGGEELRLYIAKMSLSDRATRQRAILSEHANGATVMLLAKRHGLTTRRINQILRAQRMSPADVGTPWAIDRGFLAVP